MHVLFCVSRCVEMGVQGGMHIVCTHRFFCAPASQLLCAGSSWVVEARSEQGEQSAAAHP